MFWRLVVATVLISNSLPTPAGKGRCGVPLHGACPADQAAFSLLPSGGNEGRGCEGQRQERRGAGRLAGTAET